MAYFPDCTPCTYFGSHETGPLVAVGWLAGGHEYSRGDPGEEVVKRLREFSQGWWHPFLFLGYHECDLCRYGECHSKNNLFIPGRGVTYASPEAIVHYVCCHDYLPPTEFCEAVLASPQIDSQEYFAALEANGWPVGGTWPPENPISPLLEEHRRRLPIDLLEARGNTIIAAIVLYNSKHGRLPPLMSDATALIPGDEIWQYEAGTGGYFLKAYSEPEGISVLHDSNYPGWKVSRKDQSDILNQSLPSPSIRRRRWWPWN